MARKPRGKKFADEYESMPSSDETARRWKEFMQRLDDLNRNVCELTELGQLLVMALRDSAQYTGNPLLGLINKLVGKFGEVREEYAEDRANGG